jgi:uncharacterized membrane protein YhaH (DUF805 family)
MNLMFQPLKKYAVFEGRARRAEYWQFFVLTLAISILGQVLIEMFKGVPLLGFVFALALVVVCLGLIVPSLAVGFRRLHDIDKSAWWLLIGLIPLIGVIVLLVFFVLPGTPGPNRFGPDPKGGEAPDAIASPA